MATSGTITGTVSGNSAITSRIVWNLNSQSVENNTSSVTVTLGYKRSDSQTTYGTGSWKLTINGTSYTGSKYVSISGSWVDVFSKTVTITHGSDGSKTFNMSASGSYIPGTSLEGTNCSGSGTLTTIPRASTFNSVTSSVALGSKATISITAKSSSFYHRATWTCGTTTVTQNLGQVGTTSAKTYTYTIPTTWAGLITTSTSKTASVKIQTYSNSAYTTAVGSATTKNFTVTVPNTAAYKPTVSLSKTLGNATGLGNSVYVQGKTSVSLSATGAANGSATIKSYVFKRGSTSIKTISTTSTSASTSETTNTTGTITYSVTITDSRGRTATASQSITVYGYSAPVLTINNCYRSNSSGAKDATSGTYIYIKATFSCASVGGSNQITTSTAQYKLSSASAYGSNTTLTSGTGSVVGANGIAVDKTYNVKVTITDKVGTTITSILNIPTIYVTMDFRSGGTGVAIGKIADTDNLFDVGLNMRVNSKTTNEARIEMKAANYNVRSILHSGNGNFGFAEHVNSSEVDWLIRVDQSKNVYITHPLTVSDSLTASSSVSVGGAFSAPKSIVHGGVSITPSAANTPTAKAVTWTAMAGTPNVTATAVTTVPGTQVTGVAVANKSTTGCQIYVTRTNTTAFNVDYIAIY